MLKKNPKKKSARGKRRKTKWPSPIPIVYLSAALHSPGEYWAWSVACAESRGCYSSWELTQTRSTKKRVCDRWRKQLVKFVEEIDDVASMAPGNIAARLRAAIAKAQGGAA